MHKSDYAFSIAIHLSILITIVIVSSITPPVNINIDDDIINVTLPSFSIPTPPKDEPEIVPEQRPTIPTAVEADDEIATVIEPTTIKEEKKIKPKPKPEEKPKEKEAYQPEAKKGEETVAGATGDSTTEVSQDMMRGSRFGGAAVDNPSFNYPFWFDLAFSKIDRNWSNPVYASEPIECTIYFQVISSGKILKIEIEKSSGIPAFDRACMRAVERSKPLPPLPPDFVSEIIGIHLVFPYQPR